jgi:GntR family transcriptional repressor for pyruvate dehydrogenase complex
MNNAIRMIYPELGSSKLSDQIVNELERRIMSRELRPNERLPTENEFAELLGVSRTSVRDAMRTLAARGLVRVRQGHGMVVAEPSDTTFGEALVVLLMRSEMTMGDVMAARAAIETELGRLAARRATPADWDRLDERVAEFRAAVASNDWERAEDEHLGFHLALLKAINLPALEILLKPMHQIILLSAVPPTIDDKELWDVEAHPPIVAALRRRDETDTYRTLQHHFRFLSDERYAALRRTFVRDAQTVHDVLASLREGQRTKRLTGLTTDLREG